MNDWHQMNYTITTNPFWPTCKTCNKSFHIEHYEAHQLTHEAQDA